MAPYNKTSTSSRKNQGNGTALSSSKCIFNSLLKDRTSDDPVVASYCATFLKPEMLHIYRQITSLRRVRPVVIAQKLENRECFPFRDIHVIRKPTFHFLRRIWFKQIADRPWQISPAEVHGIERALTESKAQLLHIYFGHIAVLLRPRSEERRVGKACWCSWWRQ